MRNARFWTYTGRSWVKLTLRPGQRLRWSRCGRTDEGWYREETCWFHARDRFEADTDDDEPLGPCVSVTSYSEGMDCDGPSEAACQSVCEIGRLSEVDVECAESGEVYRVPAWERVYASQRDRYAEAMGY